MTPFHLHLGESKRGISLNATEETSFRTPLEELFAFQEIRRPRRASNGQEMDALLSTLHSRQLKPLSWLHDAPDDFAQWREDFLLVLKHELVLSEALDTPSDPVLLSRVDCGDYWKEEVLLTLTPPFQTIAWVTTPKTTERKRHPALVLLHSMGSLGLYGKEKFLMTPDEPAYLTAYREEFYSGESLLANFARAGYVCISIDAIGFGSRTLNSQAPNYDQLRRQYSQEEAENESLHLLTNQFEQWERALAAVGSSVASLIATDDLRTVDYLISRDDVDPTRIGCTGLSFGSFRCNYLSAIDDRIRAAASTCWVSTLDGLIDYNLLYSLGFFAIPGGLYQDYDIVDILIASAPKPFLAISGWEDILMQPSGMAQAHLAMRSAWDHMGHGDALGSLFFNAPHEFNIDMQKQALAFFDRHL